MDQKRAMLYPQVEFNTPSAPLPTPTNESTPIVIAQPHTQPQPALPPQQQQQQEVLEPTIVQTAPTNLGPNPCRLLCPACGAQKTTRRTHTVNARTHLAASLICLVGCRTGNHYCRKCNTFLGAYDPQGVK